VINRHMAAIGRKELARNPVELRPRNLDFQQRIVDRPGETGGEFGQGRVLGRQVPDLGGSRRIGSRRRSSSLSSRGWWTLSG
jgi:hypothetical protein